MTAPLDPFAPLREALATYNAGGCAILKHDDTLLLARLLREHEERGKDAARLDYLESLDKGAAYGFGTESGRRFVSLHMHRDPFEDEHEPFDRATLREALDAARSPHQEPTE